MRFICLVVAMVAGCSSATTTDETYQHVKDVVTVQVYAPLGSYLVWCKGSPSECFDTARFYCPVGFHQASEQGMAFPAIMQETGGWRMLIACDDK